MILHLKLLRVWFYSHDDSLTLFLLIVLQLGNCISDDGRRSNETTHWVA